MRIHIMLSSTIEYLQALRDRDFLRFLEWPLFIQTKYLDGDEKILSGEALVDLLVFEWVINGFSDEDVAFIAQLYTLHEPTPLAVAELDYAVVVLSVALIQCMVYKNAGLFHRFLSTDEGNQKTILTLGKELSTDEQCALEAIDSQKLRFEDLVNSVSAEEKQILLEEVVPIIKLRYQLGEYRNFLQRQSQEEELIITRSAVVDSLAIYLASQYKYTADVVSKVDEYVNTIRTLSPKTTEEIYLKKIAPPTQSDIPINIDTPDVGQRVLKVVTRLGLHFFATLLSEDASRVQESDLLNKTNVM